MGNNYSSRRRTLEVGLRQLAGCKPADRIPGCRILSRRNPGCHFPGSRYLGRRTLGRRIPGRFVPVRTKLKSRKLPLSPEILGISF